MTARQLTGLSLVLALVLACQRPNPSTTESEEEAVAKMPNIGERLEKYTSVRLTSDLSVLSDRQRQMIPLLIEAARAMDDAFWLQAYGDKESLLSSIAAPDVRRFAEINYGPWDRLADNEPFIEGVGAKPPGATFYPLDAPREELDQALAESATLRSLYTVVRRDDGGGLVAVPYSRAYAEHYESAAEKLTAAADLAEDPGFEGYLRLRAKALLSDEYFESDLAWMDMKSNTLDIVIGPIEVYEDALFNYKAANEAYVLIKDRAWSARLEKYAAMLPALQQGLPVPDAYKQEMPGTDSDLGAYDVLYYAGDCNAGSKTIAINLPNDEEVQRLKGSRRLQLKNAMRAKFDKIVAPIAEALIAPEQRPRIQFDAFFENVMFHEVAHGLGINNTITGQGTVRSALKEHGSALEEGKADVLGLYMVSELHEQGEIDHGLMDNYVTFVASIFRSIRFGAASAHGVANLIRYNFFTEQGAFERDEITGLYRVDETLFPLAVNALSEKILRLQGDGDYAAVSSFVATYSQIGDILRADLQRLVDENIPIDVVFEQGVGVLGLEQAP